MPSQPEDTYRVKVEYSVGGYHADEKTFVGTLSEIKVAAVAANEAFYKEVRKYFNKHGDHRAYCPQFANGYPSGDPDDDGVIDITVIEVTKQIVVLEDVPYYDDVSKNFRKAIEGE